MTQPTIDGELPDWVCIPDDDYPHLTTFVQNHETGFSGCAQHHIAGGCSLPQPELTNLIAQEANKARVSELKRLLSVRHRVVNSIDLECVQDRIAQLEKRSNNG